MINKKKIYNILGMIVWVMIGTGIITLLVSAIKNEKQFVCNKVKVSFIDNKKYRMLNEMEILSALWPGEKNGFPVGKHPAQFNLYKLEKQLERNPWILSSDLYFDQLHLLHIDVKQRTPIARVFNPDGNSFYMDSSFSILPVNSNDVISLPVFTNFYINPTAASVADSVILKRIATLSEFILADPFWMAQIEAVNINADHSFEMVPQVGDQVIHLGERDDWKNLFSKLSVLYQYLNKEEGWSKYSKIDLQFKDQVVCIKQDALFKVTDSTTLLDSSMINTLLPDSIKNNKK
jgi:cell division protein FtsQ